MSTLVPANRQPQHGEEIFICPHLAAGRNWAYSSEDLFHGRRGNRRVYPVYFRWRWWEGRPGKMYFRGRESQVWFMALCCECWKEFDKQAAAGGDAFVDGGLIFWYGTEPAVFLEQATIH